MLSCPTDLSTEEQQTAASRLRELAETFAADGTLRTAQWREVFTRTWRHPYVPSYYPELGSPQPVSAADEGRRAEWLTAVYSDQTLITKIIQVPGRSGGPGHPRYASSSSLPSLVLTMLEALELVDGCRVLEIGTGTGYNAALLCERLGSHHVTSVDIDPELVEQARGRLAANGYTPTLAAVDGVDGYPQGAPYDRIIATCSVPAIPPAWLVQTAPSGMIMADVRGLLGGTVAALTVDENRTATGRFLPGYFSFMPLRPGAQTFASMRPRLSLTDGGVDSVSDVDPKFLRDDDGHLQFVVQCHLPDLTWRYAYGEDGDIATQLETPDGSVARAWHTLRDGGFAVTQAGPRRLWDRVEQAVAFWQHAGRPNYDQFGITATTTEQYVWYDHPDNEHRWPLPATRLGRDQSRARAALETVRQGSDRASTGGFPGG